MIAEVKFAYAGTISWASKIFTGVENAANKPVTIRKGSPHAVG
jgi:hypothetical protein